MLKIVRGKVASEYKFRLSTRRIAVRKNLKKAENLLVMGLHPSEVVRGYELACGKALAELESA